MTPDVDTFHALARSAPWRWRSLHFRTRSSSWDEVEAYVERPGRLSLRHADGSVERVEEERHDAVPLPHEVSPPLRADGLVARRPASCFEVRYDDPMWRNYSWVAMLDPEELSHDVRVQRLRVDTLAGREVWRADLAPEEGYEARCPDCCDLLWRAAGWYDVALDVRTGVVARCLPEGGRASPWQELDVLEADGPPPAWAEVAT